MESLSTYAKRFISQINKPDVDFVYGLSPVISIEQKTIQRNPRSTVGTMTDIASYLNLLYATISEGYNPWSEELLSIKSASVILDALMSLKEGSQIELRAPIYPVYGEDFSFLFTEIRKKGYRRMYIDGKLYDLQEDIDIDESRDYQMEVLIDSFHCGKVRTRKC
ncbi:hypothetical protein [Okeania hirsuta]|uniref:hypothetical protein n=1 Tax=Okeania hirsuta TaxID=1458930 RepID=UPI001960D48C|nr:hypothetical protein [Okeania hirsuta]